MCCDAIVFTGKHSFSLFERLFPYRGCERRSKEKQMLYSCNMLRCRQIACISICGGVVSSIVRSRKPKMVAKSAVRKAASNYGTNGDLILPLRDRRSGITRMARGKHYCYSHQSIGKRPGWTRPVRLIRRILTRTLRQRRNDSVACGDLDVTLVCVDHPVIPMMLLVVKIDFRLNSVHTQLE